MAKLPSAKDLQMKIAEMEGAKASKAARLHAAAEAEKEALLEKLLSPSGLSDDDLIEKAEIAVSPGIGFGEHGEGFVRIALVENEQRIRQAARSLRRFLETSPEKLHNIVPLARRR